MRLAVNIHALPIYKKNRIASLLCIFETTIPSIYRVIFIFQTTIDTIFICFCEDVLLNDGVQRPYFMSIGLKVGCCIVQKNTGVLTQFGHVIRNTVVLSEDIVLPRSNGYVYICLFVNNEIKTFGWHIQKSGVVLKIICCQHDSSAGRVYADRKYILFS